MTGGVLQRLIVTVIVHSRPAAHGPAIVKLPIHRAVAVAFVAAPMLGRVAHALLLTDL